MRIATYNIEWMNSLFDARGALLEDGTWSARYNISRASQLAALGMVFTAMDADAVMIIEAPGHTNRRRTTAMLETFAAAYGLRTRSALLGFGNDTQQQIALLYDPDRITVAHDPLGPSVAAALPEGAPRIAPRFDTSHLVDLDIDGRSDHLRFNKPPLEIAVTSATGTRFRMIGVHMKSKAPHGASSPDEVKRLGIASRREHLAQCLWLRERVLEHLAAGDSLLVMGDFNDGPGLDRFEKLFGRSGVEIVVGWDEPREKRLFDPHARVVFGKKLAAAPATARFYLAEQGQYFSALLDYIMVSPDLRAAGLPDRAPKWRIWHPFDDPGCYRNTDLREALLTASDHFPVTIDLPL